MTQLKLTPEKTAEDGKIAISMTEIATVDMGAEISAMCLAEDSDIVDLLYITLYDSPYYSLNVLSLRNENYSLQPTLKLLARIPLTSLLELPQTKTFY